HSVTISYQHTATHCLSIHLYLNKISHSDCHRGIDKTAILIIVQLSLIRYRNEADVFVFLELRRMYLLALSQLISSKQYSGFKFNKKKKIFTCMSLNNVFYSEILINGVSLFIKC